MKKIILAILTTVLSVGAASADDYILDTIMSIDPITIPKGAVVQLPININNGDREICTYGFHVVLPEGLEFELVDGELTGQLTERATDHVLGCRMQTDGSGGFLVYSLTNAAILPPDGAVLTTPVRATGDAGTYDIIINHEEVVEIIDRVGDGKFNRYYLPEGTKFPVTVIDVEEIRFTDNQLYGSDVTITEGEDATMDVYYNSTSDVYEFRCAVQLPAGVTATAVTFEPVVTDVANFTTDWTAEGTTVNLSGVYGGGRRDVPATGGNQKFATMALNTASLAPGTYNITFGGQFLSNDDNDFEPADYSAILTVKPAPVLEACAQPVITIENHKVMVKCATPGARLHTSIVADDHQDLEHDDGEEIELSGVYNIKSYATADGYAASEPTNAMLLWTNAAQTQTDIDAILAGTDRAVVICVEGGAITLHGTVANEDVALYALDGTQLFAGKSSGGSYTLPYEAEAGQCYILQIGARSLKLLIR